MASARAPLTVSEWSPSTVDSRLRCYHPVGCEISRMKSTRGTSLRGFTFPCRWSTAATTSSFPWTRIRSRSLRRSEQSAGQKAHPVRWGHRNLVARPDLLGEVLDWFDRYLGPVESVPATSRGL